MDKKYENGPIPPTASVCIDAALGEWDYHISDLANNYLGKNIRNELSDLSYMFPLYGHVVILGTLTSQQSFVSKILRAYLEEVAVFSTLTPAGAKLIPVFSWCAKKVGLSGYAPIFYHVYGDARFGTPKASNSLLRPVTEASESREDVFYLGTLEDPSWYWANEPIGSLKTVLNEMMKLCLFRNYPLANDWGWSEEQYDGELDANAQFIRARLGLPPKMPAFPEDPTVVLPAGFTHLPPVKTWKNEIFGEPV